MGQERRIRANAPTADRPQTAYPANGQGGFRLGPIQAEQSRALAPKGHFASVPYWRRHHAGPERRRRQVYPVHGLSLCSNTLFKSRANLGARAIPAKAIELWFRVFAIQYRADVC
jgi:hypothetical protein